jgi:hypothetical protein
LDYAQGSPGTFDSAETGAPPAALSAANVCGEAGVSELSVGFAGAMQTGATNRRTQSSRHERGGTAGMFKTVHPTHPYPKRG